MAGGDIRVITSPGVASMGSANLLHAVDANSVKKGNMTEPRTVNGQNVFMTQEGAKLYDRYSAEVEAIGGGSRVEKDPGFLKTFFMGDIKEEAVGTP